MAKETSWPEHVLLWEIPLPRLLQYYHAALRSHDIWTVKQSAPADVQIEALLAFANQPPPEF